MAARILADLERKYTDNKENMMDGRVSTPQEWIAEAEARMEDRLNDIGVWKDVLAEAEADGDTERAELARRYISGLQAGEHYGL